MATASISLRQALHSQDGVHNYLKSQIQRYKKVYPSLDEPLLVCKVISVVKSLFEYFLLWPIPLFICALIESISGFFPSFKKKVTILRSNLEFRSLRAKQIFLKIFFPNWISVSCNRLSPTTAWRLKSNDPYQVHPSAFYRRDVFFQGDQMFFSKMTNGICAGMCGWFTILLSSQARNFKNLDLPFEDQLIRIARFFEIDGSKESAICHGLAWSNKNPSNLLNMTADFSIYKSLEYTVFLHSDKNEHEVAEAIEKLPPGVYNLMVPRHAMLFFKFPNKKAYIFDPNIGLTKFEDKTDSTMASQAEKEIRSYVNGKITEYVQFERINIFKKGEVLPFDSTRFFSLSGVEQLSSSLFKETYKTTKWPKLHRIFWVALYSISLTISLLSICSFMPSAKIPSKAIMPLRVSSLISIPFSLFRQAKFFIHLCNFNKLYLSS